MMLLMIVVVRFLSVCDVFVFVVVVVVVVDDNAVVVVVDLFRCVVVVVCEDGGDNVGACDRGSGVVVLSCWCWLVCVVAARVTPCV